MIAELLSILDLPENRRNRFADPDRRSMAERIYARHEHRQTERAMHGRTA